MSLACLPTCAIAVRSMSSDTPYPLRPVANLVVLVRVDALTVRVGGVALFVCHVNLRTRRLPRETGRPTRLALNVGPPAASDGHRDDRKGHPVTSYATLSR